MKKILYTLLILTTLVSAEDDITSLLNSYESESSSEKKTKIESAGHLIMYTRDELDKMQANKLKGVVS